MQTQPDTTQPKVHPCNIVADLIDAEGTDSTPARLDMTDWVRPHTLCRTHLCAAGFAHVFLNLDGTPTRSKKLANLITWNRNNCPISELDIVEDASTRLSIPYMEAHRLFYSSTMSREEVVATLRRWAQEDTP